MDFNTESHRAPVQAKTQGRGDDREKTDKPS
jgi:hypothetical protein